MTVTKEDAGLILEFHGGEIESLPCKDRGDTNCDGAVDSIDAELILQFYEGLIPVLVCEEAPPGAPRSNTPPVSRRPAARARLLPLGPPRGRS